MGTERPRCEAQEAASKLVGSLAHRGQEAGIHLARLILADDSEESCAYRAFARALARQLQHSSRTGRPIGEDEVVRMLRAAARELVDDAWDG